MPAQSPTVQRRRLGIELRRLREQAGLTIEEVATVLECSHSKISRIETGRVGATPRDVRDMLELYKVRQDQRDALILFARKARQRGWWQAYSDTPIIPLVGLETAANRIEQYEARVVPGLLQTRDYAGAIIGAQNPDLSPEQIERWIELRMARQQILRQTEPPELVVVLEECVLRRPVGGRRVMREQLRLLAEAATLPAVTLQVLPLSVGEHAAISGAFVILGFSEPDGPDVVYLELDAGDLYVDTPAQVRRYADAFERLRRTALSPNDSAAVLATAAAEL